MQEEADDGPELCGNECDIECCEGNEKIAVELGGRQGLTQDWPMRPVGPDS
jgi:hypothetical protein